MLSHRQKTLRRSTVELTGLRLDEDLPASLWVHPAPPDTGIAFLRTDLPGTPHVPCSLANLREQSRWSALEVQGTWVHHTEHILAALLGCGIDNALIELSCDRVPVLAGGSCQAFTHALRAAGLLGQDAPRQVYMLTEPVYLSAPLDSPQPATAAPLTTVAPAHRALFALPARTLSVSYVFQVPAVPGMRAGLCEFAAGAYAFDDQLAAARTYYLQLEKEAVAPLLSSAQRDYVVLDAASPQELVDEVARHKTADLLGDLFLLGRPLLARLSAWRTGHRFHHEFLRTLFRRGLVRLETLEAPLGEPPAGSEPA
jgi:UDP-3-O-[3-hydroxymyristoyl] N-acetylglucosamine deacetylase/UDP-3-O-[3-hydroxymyristoyl] N-acetylglucosamine deacetylase/3-hydroxyacyl-[acyl-carrier-protein] dehydratase